MWVLSLAALATGCGAGEEPQPWADSPTQVASQPLSALPSKCQDIKAADPQAVDGEFTLYVRGQADSPWTAWCQNMAGTPSEYLTLTRTGADTNFAQYTAGGSSAPGTNVRTTYTRLRVDPVTLQVLTGDQRFSTSTGALSHGSTRVTSMPFGVAMSCNGTRAPANIDLRGTPFAVAPSQLVLGGWRPVGSTDPREANQVYSLQGGGSCGWNGPVGSFNPFNQSGAPLQLYYSGPRPATCQDIKAANPEALDGDYTLHIAGDPQKPWSAWCQNMAGTPAEYLRLVQTGTSVNYSQYTAGVHSGGSSVRTTYTRLRIDPVTLRVDTADQTFSSSNGGTVSHGGELVTSMPYAVAMGCDNWGMGNVDLRGTPFAVASGQFTLGGMSTAGNHVYSEANRAVSLSASGGCGWSAPLNSYNPFNQNGLPLQLVYAPPQ
jgi:hypothetical protein